MNWWCAATGQSWSWEWRAYPGVWLFVLALALGYHRMRWRGDAGWGGRGVAWFATGLLLLWVALDWPLGALGAGYLLSAHTVSYILLSMVVPPCLIQGFGREDVVRALARPGWAALLRFAARPGPALAGFSVVLFATHVPAVVDALTASQLGALLVDLAWIGGGLWLWWPVMAPDPEVASFRRPLKMAYLFAATLPAIIPSAFLTFAEYPLYATYELAPRVARLLTAQEDQKIAGLLMKLVGDLPVWFAFGVIFFRWSREAEAAAPPPVHPSAVTR